LRAARLQTLRRALELARSRAVDAFIVAGDLFEDNLVDDTLVSAVADLFAEFSSVSVFLLPGNHDPYTGPDSVWHRRPLAKASSNVRILTKAEAIDLGEVVLLASPLQQKISTLDPSMKLAELARDLPAGAAAIGVTHGAPAIEGKHQPNDFPIALDAASRAGLAYLAIGHWHNWLADLDGGRIVMPGTPEPDRFDHERCGFVSLVEIPGGDLPPKIEPIQVATLTWKDLTFDLLAEEASRTSVAQALDALASRAAQTVVRITVTGSASPAVLAEVLTSLENRTTGFLAAQIVDRSAIALSATELAALQAQHPILAQVLGDLAQMETFATGQPNDTSFASTPITLAETQELLRPSKIDLATLAPTHFAQMRQLLLQTLQEVAP